MAKAQRDYELKKATYDIEVNTRRAQADLAYQLQVSGPNWASLGCSVALLPSPLFRLDWERLRSVLTPLPLMIGDLRVSGRDWRGSSVDKHAEWHTHVIPTFPSLGRQRQVDLGGSPVSWASKIIEPQASCLRIKVDDA